MAGNDVELKVGADTAEAVKNLKNLEKQSQEISKSVSGAFGAIKAAAAAAVAIFAGKQVLNFFESGIDAAVAQEQAMAGLAQQLKLTGEFSQGALDSFAAFGDEMEKTSTFGDDVVISQVAVAKSFGATNEQAKTLVQAAIELSAATGENLDTSVDQLGKTLQGLTAKTPALAGALSGLSSEALKSGAAFQVVLDRFGGSSQAKIETFAGSIIQAKNAFGNFQESFGKIITENPQVLAAIQVIKDLFVDMQAVVEENATEINDFVTGALKGMAVGFSTMIPVVNFFIKALEGLASVVTLAFGGIVEIVGVVAKAWVNSYGAMIESVLRLTDAVGLTDGAAKDFEDFTTNALKSIDELADGTAKFAADNVEKFDSLNRGIDKFQQYVDDAAVKIFSANKKIAESDTSTQQNRARTTQLSAKDLKSLEKDYESLYKKVISESLNARDKEIAAYNDNIKELKRLDKEKIIGIEKINILTESIEKTHQKNLTEIALKESEDRKKQIETILKDSNFVGVVKLVLAKGTADDLKKEAKTKLGTIIADTGASIVSAVAQGEKGFSALVANLVKSIPVFGNLIAAAVELGTLSPEENKKAIEGFAKGIESSVDNFNTNLQRLPDILQPILGPLIEKLLGPLFANFVSSMVKSLSAWPKLIPVVAAGVARGISAIGGIMADAFKKAFYDIGAEWGRFFENARTFFGSFSEKVRDAFSYVIFNNPLLEELRTINGGIQVLTTVVNFFVELFKSIPAAFADVTGAINNIGDKFTGAFDNLGSKLTDGFNAVVSQVKTLSDGIINSIKELPQRIKNAIGDFYTSMKNALVDVFKQFFNSFEQLGKKLSALAGGNGALSGGTGGNNPLATIAAQIPGNARGLTEVPPGFSNDSFMTRLTSGERVVDPNANSDLKEFLANAKSGGLNSGEAISLLRQIAAQSGGGAQTVYVTIDKKVIGKTMLDLNRRNERTTA